ncbi:hypothetical protein SAMN05660909_04216 [Chitinophaga terrae (ex Kim and Jung 2007)]|uniref:Uncharacterized protein n=1 Tax=Chitinophaga terrae (ex Kim and Jung 2007) TaxID=408074 RepID=A0A1H4F7S7_9BACT|nr:hypothetical protein [Chitinophaga terrae (ex Kim and Jung 2007)]MDQ0105108.1 hypothetical protein [Chitinophaga terrae (ex Kim and Jung 2007)]SEA93415.1 hypothetical protein SAMN05660909_04216 [Chitinophaga terrae (ex Kim and Jung 2007)]
MRRIVAVLLLLLVISSCRTQKKGCPQPRRNWGAEKVLDELSKPKR